MTTFFASILAPALRDPSSAPRASSTGCSHFRFEAWTCHRRSCAEGGSLWRASSYESRAWPPRRCMTRLFQACCCDSSYDHTLPRAWRPPRPWHSRCEFIREMGGWVIGGLSTVKSRKKKNHHHHQGKTLHYLVLPLRRPAPSPTACSCSCSCSSSPPPPPPSPP